MTVLHVGSTKKYSAGWDQIFQKRAKKTAGKATAARAKKTARPAGQKPRTKGRRGKQK